jgi:hypothetical protein
MRKFSFVLIATIIGLSPVQSVSACGDKTMRVKTGLRYYQTQIAKTPFYDPDSLGRTTCRQSD